MVHKRSKPSVFLDDILSAPHLRAADDRAVWRPSFRQRRTTRRARQRLRPLFDETASPRQPRVYSRIGEWALAYRPPVFEPLQLSASAIETYQTCPQKYLFSDVWGIPGGPRAATTFGNVMHTTIKHFVAALRKGQRPPFEEVETIFRREWTSAGFEDSYQEEMYQRDGIEQLRAFYASALAAPPDVLRAGKALHARSRKWRADHRAHGSDQSPGARASRKSSTTRPAKPKTATQAQKDLQLGIYALAAREVLGLEPARLVYYNLQNNQCVAATRDGETACRNCCGAIQEVAADIRAREFPATPGFFCRTCEFRFLVSGD